MEMLSVNWSNAFVVLGLGVGIVFVVLVMLVFLLNGFSWFFIKKEKTITEKGKPEVKPGNSIEEEKAVAIAMALYQFYQEPHDEESYIISINQKKTSWNSKIFGLNNFSR